MTAYFVGGATRHDVLHGQAVLSITDDGTTDEQAYWCEALFEERGEKCVGFRLRKFGTGDVYDVPRALDGCTCTTGPTAPSGRAAAGTSGAAAALPTVKQDARRPWPAGSQDRARRDDGE